MVINNTRYSSEIIYKLIKWQPYCDWFKFFCGSKCQINRITLQGAILRDDESLYSAYIEVHLFTPENQSLIRSILIRGSGCVVIPYFYNSTSINFVMVKQRRIQSGDFTYEFPSGKIEDCSKPNFSAALELSEETGINIQPECLRLLAKDIVVCESAFDEQVTWYSCEISEKDYLKNLNSHHGIKEDGEHITIHALTFDALKEINSFQVKTALQLLLENQIIDLGAMKN